MDFASPRRNRFVQAGLLAIGGLTMIWGAAAVATQPDDGTDSAGILVMSLGLWLVRRSWVPWRSCSEPSLRRSSGSRAVPRRWLHQAGIASSLEAARGCGGTGMPGAILQTENVAHSSAGLANALANRGGPSRHKSLYPSAFDPCTHPVVCMRWTADGSTTDQMPYYSTARTARYTCQRETAADATQRPKTFSQVSRRFRRSAADQRPSTLRCRSTSRTRAGAGGSGSGRPRSCASTRSRSR